MQDSYDTPVGSLPIDKASESISRFFMLGPHARWSPVVEELRATGRFEDMSRSTDEAEHSLEMHLPYIRKVFEGYVLSSSKE